MGTKELAYPISGHNKADFYTFDIHAEVGMKLAELNLSLNRNPSIIRYMVSKTN
jgi:ribosomal protein S6